jgi:WD40 repeat protein
MIHFPITDINKGRLFAAGFDNGIVRILNLQAEGIDIMKAFKAHDDPIVGIQHSVDLTLLVTASTQGDIFFFEMDGERDCQLFEPLCTFKLPDGAMINDFKFCDDDQHILFGCQNGRVYKVRRPNTKEIDNTDSYHWENPDLQTWTIKLMDF